MQNNKDLVRSFSAIYKNVYRNKEIHRNTLKKAVLLSGKVGSQTKFNEVFNSLLESKKLKIEKEIVSVNPNAIQVAVLQKECDEYYIITPYSKRHYAVPKNVAVGYKVGDLLDVIIEKIDNQKEVFILGKSEKRINREEQFMAENTAVSTPPTKKIRFWAGL